MPNVGFITIVVFILIIFPGLLSRRFYYSGEFTKQFKSKEWTYSLIASCFIGLLMHWLFYKLIILNDYFPKLSELFNNNFVYEHNYQKFIEELVKFINNNKENNEYIDFSYNALLLNTLYYLIFLSIFSITITWSFQKTVKNLNIDSRYKLLRYENYWYYYLRGEIGHFKEYKDIPTRNLKYTIAHVLTKNNEGGNTLYEGVVSQYIINSKTLDLEYLYLTKVAKWSNSICQFTKIPQSDCFCIKNNQILNLSFKYEFDDRKRHRILEAINVIVVLLIILFIRINPSDENYWTEIIISKLFYSLTFLFIVTKYTEWKKFFKKRAFIKYVSNSSKTSETKKNLIRRADKHISNIIDTIIVIISFISLFLLTALLFSYKKELNELFEYWIYVILAFPLIIIILRLIVLKLKKTLANNS